MTAPNWHHASLGHCWACQMNTMRAAVDQVFILRFWREATGPGQEFRWRAQVRNVNSRQRQVADDIEAAFALVLEQLEHAGGTAET